MFGHLWLLFPHVRLMSFKNMSSSYVCSADYQRAISVLNGLQSNVSVLNEARKRIESGGPSGTQMKIQLTYKYLKRCNVKIEDLEDRVIHVAGTKGKGSTCAFTESILRHHGFKTGFFSSPHLVSVAERIRINGKPLSPSKFTSYFWNVYNTLYKYKDNEEDMPSYFKFLTVMAFSIFQAEKVDVAVIEVGVGGEYDCTNVFRKPAVVGISSLGLDHVKVLGNSLESIAWQKAGIIKPGCYRVFTASNQHPSALSVLKSRAQEKECSLAIAPGLSAYNWEQHHKSAVEDSLLKVPIQSVNCSLAIHLAHSWISKASNKSDCLVEEVMSLTIPKATADGIANCKWPGRFHRIEVQSSVVFYLDGAHTQDSVSICAHWFNTVSPLKNGVNRILVFNSTGGRSAESLLLPLVICEFTHVYFCTNDLNMDPTDSPQDTRCLISNSDALERCAEHRSVWARLSEFKGKVDIFPSVSSVVSEILSMGGPADILVTGSLHLVGAILAHIDPHLTSATSLFSEFNKLR